MTRSLLPPLLTALFLAVPALKAQEDPPSRPRARIQAPHRKPRPSQGRPLSLNDASRAELRKLPGITDALAARIIAGRPYRTKAELLLRQILTADAYERIKHRVTGRPNKD